ncbi:hypothetical protein FHS60_000176 [Alloprevotella rava]|uniref:Uncharacterized protein n=1 Tax=Alloprevotella rava TaxID=671218 RepID=A0A7W5UUB6_9BACT|nr:hypothetical protein [Alloprevotella rava]
MRIKNEHVFCSFEVGSPKIKSVTLKAVYPRYNH